MQTCELKSVLIEPGLSALVQALPSEALAEIARLRCAYSVEANREWRMSERQQKRLVRALSSEHHDDGSRRVEYLREYLSLVKGLVPVWDHVQVLHPGCGLGVWSDVLRERYSVSYLGFDISPLVIQEAQRAYAQRGEFVLQNLCERPWFRPADLIIFDYELLNSFEPPSASSLVQWAYDRLRPSGVLLGDYRPRCREPLAPYRATISIRGDNLAYSDRGTFRGGEVFGERTLSFNFRQLQAAQIRADLLRLWNVNEAQQILGSAPWRKMEHVSLSPIPTNKACSRHDVVFILTK